MYVTFFNINWLDTFGTDYVYSNRCTSDCPPNTYLSIAQTKTTQLIKLVGQNPYQKLAVSRVDKNILHSMEPEVYYRVQNSPSLVSVVKQLNPAKSLSIGY
jgi:hypothetical protein